MHPLMTLATRRAPSLLALWTALMVLSPATAQALPMYAQRSGRTCANCHVSPTIEDQDGWENPELMDRKCTMSCVACHINPTGGGLRNASGRYYGQSVLSILPTQERGYGDLHRELASPEKIWEFRKRFDKEPQAHADGDTERIVPSDDEEALDERIGWGQKGRWTTWGKPLGGPSKMAFWDGRYDDLNADPLFTLGGDLRGAYWSGSNAVFPMQTDVGAAVHPVEHLTIMGTLAGRAQNSGVTDGFQDQRGPVFMRNAFVMVHELPGMSWAKAGIFMPSYGIYLDDHTSFTRSWFEQDVSDSPDTVLGVEVGTAPNYPFATLSLFQNDASFGADNDPGWGAALNGGWRDLGWSVTGHAMTKQRQRLGRGDVTMGGIGLGFNPAYYLEKLPLTFMGEFSYGRRTTLVADTPFWAGMVEGWWLVKNGVNVRTKLDLGARNANNPGLLEARAQAGLELSPVPGVTFTGLGRVLGRTAGGEGPLPDFFFQTHVWF